MRRLAVLALLAAMGAAPTAFAPTATGSWKISLSIGNNVVDGLATLKQAGDEVTGTLGPVGDPTIAVKGVVKGNQLILQLHPRPGRTTAFDSCTVMMGEDEMAGTVEQNGSQTGTIKFVRTKP